MTSGMARHAIAAGITIILLAGISMAAAPSGSATRVMSALSLMIGALLAGVGVLLLVLTTRSSDHARETPRTGEER